MKTQTRTRTINTQFRAVDENGVKRIEGYFAVFGDVYEIGPGMYETIDRHAFDGIEKNDIRCLIDHVPHLVLGRTAANTFTVRVDEKGVWGSVIINEHDTDAMNHYARHVRGDVSQASFGFVDFDETSEVRKDGSVLFTLTRVNPLEFSSVTFPAYEKTELAARHKTADEIRKRTARENKENLKERIKNAWH